MNKEQRESFNQLSGINQFQAGRLSMAKEIVGYRHQGLMDYHSILTSEGFVILTIPEAKVKEWLEEKK